MARPRSPPSCPLAPGCSPMSSARRCPRSPIWTPRCGRRSPHRAGCPRIGALVRPGATVTIAFDDHTTGSFGPIRRVAIRAVLDELEAAGVRRSDVTLVCANALHRMLRPPSWPGSSARTSSREFGARLICHDAEDPEQIVDLGVTRRSRLSRRGAPPRRRVGPHRVRQHQLHARVHWRLEVGLRRALHVADDPRDPHARRHVDVREPQPHARRARRDGPASRGAPRQAHLQDRHAPRRSPSGCPDLRGRRRRDAARGARGAGRALSAAARGESRAGRRARLRRP